MNDKIAIWIVGLSLSSATKNIRFINNLILQMIAFIDNTVLLYSVLYTQFYTQFEYRFWNRSRSWRDTWTIRSCSILLSSIPGSNLCSRSISWRDTWTIRSCSSLLSSLPAWAYQLTRTNFTFKHFKNKIFKIYSLHYTTV